MAYYNKAESMQTVTKYFTILSLSFQFCGKLNKFLELKHCKGYLKNKIVLK